MKEEKNKTIKTNMSEIPNEDYCDIVAMQNGFDDYNVVHREGRRVLIDEQAYLRWLNRDKEL